ncbi:uncharacterized protein TrAFT101_007944 [Trichoderma asperellum]|uniref:Rhodopsin domain-containing protein n=1 Tax=Trichoderma asperellum (strain ATCC 204424 / CBS 433.97 / NBRC 101777) TaxID=1042311 RepID=A0A2T3Z385_TRIA4|nr:hypothetical protein M441DRAFT_38328 [Trichoderma asperellum CBS 433.97]PTB39269.1 hypothetical protein M441DRAFT_38328 [Trichoderma asperellum CBS 433.97]UKZ93011.1 hypothetical protein TrAFT101_007944 [Trichoderma asperellum]
MADRSGQMLVLNIIFMTLTTITVALRVYCRGWVVRSFGVDDHLMVVTWISFTAYLISQQFGLSYGTGKSRDLLTDSDNRNALLTWYVCELFYVFCTCVVKVSVGFFLLRLSVDMKHIWILRLSMASTAIFGAAFFFVGVFQCNPISTYWEIYPGFEGRCIPERTIVIMNYVASCLNCIADWTFGILPGFIVWSLNMPMKSRILVIGLLGFAAIASTATLVRYKYVDSLSDGPNFLFATVDIANWSTVEVGIGITAASLATLKPLFKLISYKAGLTDSGPSNHHWRGRSGEGRFQLGYIRSTSAPPPVPPKSPRLRVNIKENTNDSIAP